MSARDLEDFISVIETAEKISRSSTALSTIDGYYPGRSAEPSSWPSSVRSVRSVPSAVEGTVASSDTRSTWSSSRVSGVSSRSTSVESVQTVRESAQTNPALNLMQLQRVHRHPRVVARDLSPAVTPQSSPLVKRKSVSKLRRPSFVDDQTPQSSPERIPPTQSTRHVGISRQKTVLSATAASGHSPTKSAHSSSNSSPAKAGSAGTSESLENASPTPPPMTDHSNPIEITAEATNKSMESPGSSATHSSPRLSPQKSPARSYDSSATSPQKSSSIVSSKHSNAASPHKSSVGSSQHSPLVSPNKYFVISPQHSPVTTSRKSSTGSFHPSPSASPNKSSAGSFHQGSVISSQMSLVDSQQCSTQSPSLSDSSFEELEPRSEIPVPRQRIVIRQSSIRVHDHTLQDVPLVDQPVTSPQLKSKSKKRPISAPPPKTRPLKEKSEEQVDLRSYSKSLKLLGLNIPSNRVEATQLTHQDLEIRTKSPTLKTRLTKRTQSISNLQELIDSKEKITKKEYVQIKKPLCKAVFEEWYFKKMQSEVEQRRKEEEIKQEKEYEEELEKEAKKEKCSEEYKKWLMKKKLENNRLRKDRNTISSGKTGKTRRLLTENQTKKMEDKLQEWKDTKMKELRKRKKIEEDKRKAMEEEELKMAKKKEAAATEFKAWRDKLNDQMRAKMKEEKTKALEALEQKKEEAKEKREAAEASFIYWKKHKDEIREREINQRKQKRTKFARAGSNSESLRRKEAQIAYEKWLEYTEQREIEEKLAEEEQNLRYLWRPPWYPGGISEY